MFLWETLNLCSSLIFDFVRDKTMGEINGSYIGKTLSESQRL